MRQCLTNMKLVNRLLMPGSPLRSALVEGALRLAGKWDVLSGLLVTALDRPAYAASSDELGYLFDGAGAGGAGPDRQLLRPHLPRRAPQPPLRPHLRPL